MSKPRPDDPARPAARLAKAPFAEAVMVCDKCARKFKGAGKPVAKALKGELKRGGWGKARVVRTGCFGLCPKGRQVVASAGTLKSRRLLVLEPGYDPRGALLALLGPEGGPEFEPERGADPGRAESSVSAQTTISPSAL